MTRSVDSNLGSLQSDRRRKTDRTKNPKLPYPNLEHWSWSGLQKHIYLIPNGTGRPNPSIFSQNSLSERLWTSKLQPHLLKRRPSPLFQGEQSFFSQAQLSRKRDLNWTSPCFKTYRNSGWTWILQTRLKLEIGLRGSGICQGIHTVIRF